MRQILAAIQLRQDEVSFVRRMELSWSTRTVSSFAAATGLGGEELVTAASQVTLMEEERELLAEAADGVPAAEVPDLKQLTQAERDAAIEALWKKSAEEAAAKNRPGTYERLVAGGGR